jgi:hypothetical protein
LGKKSGVQILTSKILKFKKLPHFKITNNSTERVYPRPYKIDTILFEHCSVKLEIVLPDNIFFRRNFDSMPQISAMAYD